MAEFAKWYHAHVDAVSRGDGKSAVGLVSYITGQVLQDEETGRWCKRNHPGEVLEWGTHTPTGAAAYLADKEQLGKAWNDVQRSETRTNSHLANHWNLSSAAVFSEEQHIEAAQEIARRLSDRYGVMVTWGVHKPTDHGDDRNWHIHIAHNMRQVGVEGFGQKARQIVAKTTRSDEARWQRQMFADVMNERLERMGLDERVTPLSYRERGIDLKPTRHLGDEQNQLELKGIPTGVGDDNREARAYNGLKQELAQVTAQIYDLDEERQRRQAMSATTQQRPTNEYDDLKAPAPTEEETRRQAENQVGGYRQMELMDKGQDYSIRNTIETAAKQAEEAKRDEAAREEADKRRQEAGDPVDPNSRYAQALGKCFTIRDPYSSLANSAMLEYQMFQERQEERKGQIAEETDPEKIQALKTVNLIEAHEYMAITYDRLAGISRAITRGDNAGARKDELDASLHRGKALELKGDLKGYRQEMEKQETLKAAEMLHELSEDIGKRGPVTDPAPKTMHNMTSADRVAFEQRKRDAEEVSIYGAVLTPEQRKAVADYEATASGKETPEQTSARQAEENKHKDGLTPDRPAETAPQTSKEEKVTTPDDARALYAKTSKGEPTEREASDDRTEGRTQKVAGKGGNGRGGGGGNSL